MDSSNPYTQSSSYLGEKKKEYLSRETEKNGTRSCGMTTLTTVRHTVTIYSGDVFE